MSRFRVVDPAETSAGIHPQALVSLEATDGAEPEPLLRPGTELLVPDELDLSVIRGTPISDIESLTLDGRTWIDVKPVACYNALGMGKTLTVEVLPGQKRMGETAAFSVHASRIIAVGHRRGAGPPPQ